MTIVQRLLDTAQMRTQYPDWLCKEMEAAAEEITRLRKDAERYRRLRHKLTCGRLTLDEELAVIGAMDADSFDTAVDAMNGPNA